MWLRHIWHWLCQCSIWLRKIYPPRIWFMFFCPSFWRNFLFYMFWRNFFLFTFLTKLLLGGKTFFIRQTSFAKLHLANFIWQTSFGKVNLTKLHLAKLCGVRQSILWLCQVLHWLRQWHWCFQMAGQTNTHTNKHMLNYIIDRNMFYWFNNAKNTYLLVKKLKFNNWLLIQNDSRL